ncbi:cation-translocating P-type ATPase [Kineothrix sp. MB12-C1]|uniref:cation-translocating P-type ATPase n=1 Tax=Kineothrix sp. MB12-C1 TaxID=3070215 RepID=UPI0027D316EB|nr:cation-translocating P-type ATPase [Kineothrix sp. MB12-C1]WMC93545.1 cation-translocating P-type ATPase [Kineothrix sp. MB12-C1]
MKKYFNLSVKETAEDLQVNLSNGLSGNEAAERSQKYGSNRLEGGKEKSILQMAIEQLKDFLVLILMVAAIVSIFLGESLEGIVILAIVVLNTFLGVYQENKASNALKALKEMASPHAKVLRDGQVVEIGSQEVVPGDVVILEAGDYIPADLRLVESVNLKVDEAALTGESVPVEKDANAVLDEDASLGDRINSAYMGTVITYGRGKGVITDTGMKTQMGNIAGMLNSSSDESTPLQKKLDSLGKLLGIVCLSICGIIFILGLVRGMELFDIFMTSVSLAVAAIPEGLTVVVTVVLAMGMQRMVKCNAIIKRLSAVETLGSTTVICSDKTGTLTQNKMTIQRIYDGISLYDVSGTGYSPIGDILDTDGNKKADAVSKVLECIVLCNDAIYDSTTETIVGDPTEGAMVVLAHKAGMVKTQWDDKYPRLQEIPFDSDRKLMSTFHTIDGKTIMYIKGAPDELLRRCVSIELNGTVQSLSEEKRKEILATNQQFAESALRVIGAAYREMDKVDTSFESENDLTFIGLVGMIDPPREEAKDAISVCKKAGIQVKMITGDHKITATAIGRQLGIVSEDAVAVEGREISEMTDEQLQERVKTVNVFARVSPEHKVRLVDAVRANGDIAAMTGDGVNDAPSLKHADIGVAMGITGTDVSKEAADMILTDDNFASIVRAVSEGRTIYSNIRKVVGFLLSCNIGEILVIFLAMLANLEVPLVAIQLLSINLITDAFPAFALGMEKEEPGVMDRHPRDPAEPIVDKKMAIAVGIQSIALALGTLGSFLYGYYVHDDLDVARTACFFTLVLGELLRAYSSRSEKTSVFRMKVFENGYLNKCVIASLVFLIASIYIPVLNPIFSTVPLTLDEIVVALVLAFVPMLGGEMAKVFTNRK